MIKTNSCVYCGIQIRKARNTDDARSVEHMIPESAVSISRKGDFHVCRKCNTEKSKIDALFGLISRTTSTGDGAIEAANKLGRMAAKGDKAVINMIQTAKNSNGRFEVSLPFKGEDIYKYGVFLTKGEYFKQHQKLLNMEKNVVLVSWGGANLINHITDEYKKAHKNDPFHDLAQNSNVENINKECFIVANQSGSEYVFVFSRAYSLLTKVVERTEETIAQKRYNKRCLIPGFAKGEKSEYCVYKLSRTGKPERVQAGFD
ncbi:HNH endonuclease [Shewanella sp. NIFS-20-20]|uniref:HNH endonuclease n=1 Tax=Shewanella sp. NIFS-20-20 TaxID=2853806 RepID=UPI001C439B9A|nr:HNH endonuclease [Shewanella sp. NIFS-20-20]MBV7316071.1 HNH endonuclease [Shewanella sp. NIFS-20-20]